MNLTQLTILLAKGHGPGGLSTFNVTVILWMSLFVLFAFKGMSRPIWGLCLYVMTMYVLPGGWWWGKGTIVALTTRWNLFAALILAACVAAQSRIHNYHVDESAAKIFKLLTLYTLNATAVNFLLASNADRSTNDLILIWKQLGLIFLMYFAVSSRSDLKKFFYVFVLCSFYIGYEVVINQRGKFAKARLEGIFVPGAAESNYLAGLLVLAMPLLAALILVGRPRDKIIGILCAPFILDVILRCSSRGAFLAILITGVMILISSKGRMRSYALAGACMFALAVFVQAKDERIMERFYSIFPLAGGAVSGDNSVSRDPSAEHRLEFWMAASRMIAEHPLGSGGEAAFKSQLGSSYIASLGAGYYRAVHNGYLDIAAGWGLQGLALYLSAIYFAWRSLRRAIAYNLYKFDPVKAFVGICIEAALVTQLTVCMFISSLDGEWFYWLMAMMLAYGRIYGQPAGDKTDYSKQRVVVTNEMMNRAMSEDPFEDPVIAQRPGVALRYN